MDNEFYTTLITTHMNLLLHNVHHVNACPYWGRFNPAREDFTLVNLGLFPEVARAVEQINYPGYSPPPN